VKAVVLVGGFGTRLRPLTLSTPKQMLPVGPVTMFERVIERLGAAGVDEAVVSLGFRPDAFIDAFPDGECAGVRVRYAIEDEPLDTAGAIRFAARSADIDDTFLVVNGDVLADVDDAWLVERHRSLGAEATIHLTAVDDPSRYGVVALDGDRVVAFVEKPAPGTAPTNLINAGTYVFEPSVLDRIAAVGKVSVERDTFPALVAAGTLFAVASDGYWIDAGTPATYLRANLDLIDGTRSNEAAVHPLASIDPAATVERSVVGEGASIGAGARVVGSVIMAGARVGATATVIDSVVGAGASIGDGADVRELSVVGFGTPVAAGDHLAGAVRPEPSDWDI
jgi:mannose-1-phosphate guanylyltransferase